MSRDLRLYLSDILRCCEKIQRYTAGLRQEQLEADERTGDAVLRNLEIIGEAAKKVPADIREQMPIIPWPKVAGMRDWLARVYFSVDWQIVWDVVENKVPELEREVRAFIATLADDADEA